MGWANSDSNFLCIFSPALVSFVGMLKWDTIEEAHEKIKQKCMLVKSVGDLIEKYQFGKTLLSYYKTGKIMLTEVDHIETLLEKLFS